MALNTQINVVRQAPGAVAPRIPQTVPRCEQCEGRLVLGVFFDGTSNNRDNDLPQQKHSNVARLYAAYPNDLEQGHGRLYVPGVGTPFADVRDDGEALDAALGNGFGSKGEQRILFGLLGVFNAVDNWLRAKTRVAPGDFFNPQQIQALCCNSELRYGVDPWTRKPVPNISGADLSALRALDKEYRGDPLNMQEKGGLLHDWPGRNKFRHEFFSKSLERISKRIEITARPKLVEIVVDVFGFSRGAAQARAFCNLLHTLCDEDGTLFGVKFGVRFLGIFDTVASVGVQTGALGRPLADAGHMAWADPAAGGGISIHPRIHHCEHYVAMHEN